MKIVGNCPCCGNPIYGKRKSSGRVVQDPMRTCFCNLAPKTTTVTVPAPYVQPLTWPPGTWTNVAKTTGSVGTTYTVHPPKPPDEDAGMVPR